MQKFDDQQLDAEVLAVLRWHMGQANPIGRWALVTRIYGPEARLPENDDNRADRQIRQAVARLRRAGVLICDMGDGDGRYIAKTVEEYQAFRLYYGLSVFERMTTIREMDKAAAQFWPNALQPRLL